MSCTKRRLATYPHLFSRPLVPARALSGQQCASVRMRKGSCSHTRNARARRHIEGAVSMPTVAPSLLPAFVQARPQLATVAAAPSIKCEQSAQCTIRSSSRTNRRGELPRAAQSEKANKACAGHTVDWTVRNRIVSECTQQMSVCVCSSKVLADAAEDGKDK